MQTIKAYRFKKVSIGAYSCHFPVRLPTCLDRPLCFIPPVMGFVFFRDLRKHFSQCVTLGSLAGIYWPEPLSKSKTIFKRLCFNCSACRHFKYFQWFQSCLSQPFDFLSFCFVSHKFHVRQGAIQAFY